MSLILPYEHRAPFIAPGRRNRKVHWNRPLRHAINSLGKFEKEDYRRALWLPESLRQFYPRWNNQFSPGGGSDCGCCGGGDCTTSAECYESATDVEVEIPDIFTTNPGYCTECVDVGGTYILTGGPPQTYNDGSYCTGAAASGLTIALSAGCDSGVTNKCEYLLVFNINATADFGCASTFRYELTGVSVPISLPLELPYLSSAFTGHHCCLRANSDPCYITDLI